MYEAVRARPAGPSTVARLAATAVDYGYDGLVVANPADESPDYDAKAIQEAYGIDLVDGIELVTDNPSHAAGAVGHARPETTVLCLRGGSPGLNRYTVRQDRVDVLTRPMDGSGDLDHVLVRTARNHGVRLAVDLGPVLRRSGVARSAALGGLRKLRELIEAYDAPFVVTAGAGSHLELRSPRDLAALGAVAGFDQETVERGLAEWGRVATWNRERRSETYVAPGVRHEGDAE